jgi:chloride channel protein, CIC family
VTLGPSAPGGWARRRSELAALAQKSREVVLLCAITGVVTGLFVAAFERVVVDGLFDHLVELPSWALAFMPGAGLALAALAMRYGARSRDPGTADAYLREFHGDGWFALGEVPGRTLAGVFTLGFGGAMGLEGPSIYLGAGVGAALQRRLARFLHTDDRRMLLVAGAAAGVAAIFKAPATGAVFALEVPYQDDLARRMLLPALVGAASGYLVFVAINGTAAILPVHGVPGFSFTDLAGAVALGIAAGFGARIFALLLRWAKALASRTRAWWRVPAAGLVIAGCFAVRTTVAHPPLVIGSGRSRGR